MSVWPLRRQVIKPGERYLDGYDRFGNEKWVDSPPVPVKVLGWEIVRTTEGDPDSVLRTIDEAQIIAPPGALDAGTEIELEGYGMWRVEGNPLDSNNGPWWSPGLVTYKARKVTG